MFNTKQMRTICNQIRELTGTTLTEDERMPHEAKKLEIVLRKLLVDNELVCAKASTMIVHTLVDGVSNVDWSIEVFYKQDGKTKMVFITTHNLFLGSPEWFHRFISVKAVGVDVTYNADTQKTTIALRDSSGEQVKMEFIGDGDFEIEYED